MFLWLALDTPLNKWCYMDFSIIYY